MKNKFIVCLLLTTVFVLGLIAYLFLPQEINPDKLYSSYSNKSIAQLIEGSIYEANISQENEQKSNLSNLYLDIKLNNIKNICSNDSWGSTKKVLSLINVKWEQAGLWDSIMLKMGGSDRVASDLLLIDRSNNIIPISYYPEDTHITGINLTDQKSDYFKNNCKTSNDFTGFCCGLEKSKLHIKVKSHKNKAIVTIVQ